MAHRSDGRPPYQPGDRITHATRPEWGTGRIHQARPIRRDGIDAQRLVVDFPNKGRVTLDTTVAPIRAAGPAPRTTELPDINPASTSHKEPNSMTSTGSALSGNNGGWLAQLEAKATGGQQSHELWDLPDALSDPFCSDEQRLTATLETYRYSTEARSLIEWAIRQTGLEDPLSKYTRTEMEQAFPRFARDRDNHLKDLVRQLKRQGRHAMIDQVRSACRIPAAVSALDRAMRA